MTTTPATAIQIGNQPPRPRHRTLADETAVALTFNGTTQAVLMATPADLTDFAIGFSLSEGIITDPSQIIDLTQVPQENGIEMRLWLAADQTKTLTARRRAMIGPVGCGLCGIDSLTQATRTLPSIRARPDLSVAQITSATNALRACQPLHDATRAAHATGFLTPDGLICPREDVGRHNALDKVIGALATRGVDAATGAFVLTSRVSIELIQKCAFAGCGMLIAVSAPTARATATALQAGITLVAHSKGDTAEVFSHPSRIPGASDVA